MIKRILILIAITPVALWAQQTDSLTLMQRMMTHRAAHAQLLEVAYQNPAIYYDRYESSLTDIGATGAKRSEVRARVPELGSGRDEVAAKVVSFIVNEKNRLWGTATYHNGTDKDVQWNETSDYALLYPYVMVDSIGGDLPSELYYFKGGYGYRIRRWTIGAEGSYRALMAYRNVDPRPKNISSDLNVNLGAAYRYGNYSLGAALYAGRYKQTNDLEFFNEYGVPNIYHLTGLGNDYYRFRGSKGSVLYQGSHWGASLNLMPAEVMTEGWSASVYFDRFGFDKILSEMNDLPINAVREYKWRGELAWRSDPQLAARWGAALTSTSVNRIGSHYIYGSSSGVIFPLIATADNYQNKTTEVTIGGYYERQPTAAMQWGVKPRVAYHRLATRYVSPDNSLSADLLDATAEVYIGHATSRWYLSASAEGGYRATLASHLMLATPPDEDDLILLSPVAQAYDALARGWVHYALNARIDYRISDAWAIYLAAHVAQSVQAPAAPSELIVFTPQPPRQQTISSSLSLGASF